MSLNWREINLVLEELSLPGRHIQKILQPDYESLVLELYAPGERSRLLLSLRPGSVRLHAISTRPTSTQGVPRFAELLRSRVKGGKIEEVRQLGTERILRFSILRGGEQTLLYFRLWGGAANVIATEPDGRILDAFYRRPKRGEVSGELFRPEEELTETSDPDRFTVRELPGGGSFNEQLETFYAAKTEHELEDRTRAKALRDLRYRENKIGARLDGVRQRLSRYSNEERDQATGDLLMANLHRIERGQKTVELERFDGSGTVEIELDPKRAPHENAERYYAKARKARAGRQLVEEEAERLQQEQETIQKQIELAEESDDIELLRSFITSGNRAGASSDAAGPGGKGRDEERPGLSFVSHGFLILVGRTAKENDQLLRRYVRGNDWWLHVRDYPGAYVFVKSIPGKSVPLETLLDAGNLAIHYSKAKGEGDADLYYTQVKHLRRPKTGKTGLVLPTQEKNLSVRVEPERIERLMGGPSGT